MLNTTFEEMDPRDWATCSLCGALDTYDPCRDCSGQKPDPDLDQKLAEAQQAAYDDWADPDHYE